MGLIKEMGIMNKTIETSIKKRRSKVITKDSHIEQTIKPNYNWIIDKQLPYDDSEYIKENY